MEVGLFLIHAVIGLLIAAHGSQKLFGWLGGAGLEGTGGMMESLGLVPGRLMAAAAGHLSSPADSCSRSGCSYPQLPR